MCVTGDQPSATKALSIGQCATLACLMEVTAAKPGNVHRTADFEDVSLFEFAAAATAIGPIMDGAPIRSVGETVLAAVRATAVLVASNTNLGTILLLAPLAKASAPGELRPQVARVLSELTPDDARLVYEAIGQAAAGGLGRVDEGDVMGPAPDDLLAAMRLAADRDLVARQYANGFTEVLERVAPLLRDGIEQGWSPADTIVRAHVTLMAELPDSLIARKCGADVARESAAYAQQVLRAGLPGDENYHEALADLDFWLRSDGHRRNPGTTADLIAAGLFVVLRQGILEPPLAFYRPVARAAKKRSEA